MHRSSAQKAVTSPTRAFQRELASVSLPNVPKSRRQRRSALLMSQRDSLPSASEPLPAEALWSRFSERKGSEREAREALAAGPIPDALRAQLWLMHSGTFQKSRRGVYAALQHAAEAKPGEHAQIELDISRSGIRDVEQQDKLRRVLRAYANFKPSSGYVQGQNFIVVGLLLVLPEEECFWLLSIIVDEYLPSHFTHAMTGSFVDCRVLAELLARRLPDVSNKLAQMEVSVQVRTYARARVFVFVFVLCSCLCACVRVSGSVSGPVSGWLLLRTCTNAYVRLSFLSFTPPPSLTTHAHHSSSPPPPPPPHVSPSLLHSCWRPAGSSHSGPPSCPPRRSSESTTRSSCLARRASSSSPSRPSTSCGPRYSPPPPLMSSRPP